MVRSFGMVNRPRVGCCLPAKTFKRVVLPAPFLPTRAILSLEFTRKLISSNKGEPPNSMVSCSTEIIFQGCCRCLKSINYSESLDSFFSCMVLRSTILQSISVRITARINADKANKPFGQLRPINARVINPKDTSIKTKVT